MEVAQDLNLDPLPDGWISRRLENFCTCYSGGTPSTMHREYYDGNIKWITSGDLNQRRIKEVEGRISLVGLQRSSAKQIDKGTLLIALYGATAGVTAISEIEAAINQAILAIIPKKVDREFLFQKLSYLKERIIRTYTQGGQPNLSGEIIKSLEISLPKMEGEQAVIATALSDTDALITILEKLISKKRNIKQGAMQELLKPKPDWFKTSIHQVAPLQRGFDLPSQHIIAGEFPVVFSNGILKSHWKSKVSGPGVVTGRSGTIGRVHYLEKDFWPHNTSLWVTSFKGNHPKFIFHLFSMMGFDRFATGTGVPTLNRNDIHNLVVQIPSVEEQVTITTILDDMEREISEAEKKLEKCIKVKVGMMQSLLTGKIRLA